MRKPAKFFILCLVGLTMTQSVAIAIYGHPVLYDKYNGLNEFGVTDAWSMGYTGMGVRIAIIDSGIDFATPDLIGTQARVSDTTSPFDGWPFVIDLESLSSYQQGSISTVSQYADTTSTDVTGYRITGTSKGGVYHIGDHPDRHLAKFYGQPVKVLVVDEKITGIYGTVYVDLNNNQDFRDDKPCRKGDEISYWDRDNDSYPDESGGIIYFISDGKTHLPFSRMLYGDNAKIPKSGELVAFQFDDGSHGTMCASTIAAQGKNIKGIAPDAKLIPVRTFGENDMLLCLLASLGYDGIPNTGDEADIISRSGTLTYFNKGADETSAFLEYLTTNVSPSTTIVYGNGNDGSGYGTCGSPSSGHVINVGAIYDLWWNSSSYRGDVGSFSSCGPNALGQVKPNVLATGYFAPEAKPLWFSHNGKAAWDAWGGGTSDATPHASAVVALIYQAYRAKYGKNPTSEKARDILMSAATDIDEEVFAQGAGIINARKAIEIASGNDGVLIEPALLVIPPIKAGSKIMFNFSLSNYSENLINIIPQRLMKFKTKELNLTLKNRSVFFIVPNEMLYCDVIKVSSYYPRDAGNTKLDKSEGYDLYLYNWKDKNKDGELCEDELETIAIGKWGSGLTSALRMHNPAERKDDGIVIGLKRRNESKDDNAKVVIETYRWEPWDVGINVSSNMIQLSIQTPNTTGVYQGKILLEEEGQGHCIPISFSTFRTDEILTNSIDEIYENTKIYGRFEGDGKGIWDSRFYPIYHSGHDLVTIDVAWQDPNTDIDVYLYGEDTLNTSKLWKYSTEPPIELPELKVLKENGHSMRIWRTQLNKFSTGAGYGLSYSVYFTSTGKNKEVILGELTDGLNLLVLNKVISGGNTYGENVTIATNVMHFNPINFTAKAGETVSLSLAGIDGIIGFSKGKEVNDRDYPAIIHAEKGDVVLIHSNSTRYSPHIFFDTNNNGTLDWDKDEVIFAELRRDNINPLHTDIIIIPKKGTYFLLDPDCKYYHMMNRYQNAGTSMNIKVPEQAGVYLGIAKKGDDLVPIPVEMLVKPGPATSMHLNVTNCTHPNQPFEVRLEIQDKFNNIVKDSDIARIDFNTAVYSVNIVNGTGGAVLTAPGNVGRYKMIVRSRYGMVVEDIEISDTAIVEKMNISIGDKEVAGKKNEISDAKKVTFMKPKEDSPSKINSLSIRSADGNIRLTWQASQEAKCYRIYRLRNDNVSKELAEVNDTEYTMKGEPWSSYTFRVSAVNSIGNEIGLSDPIGIVVIP